MKSYLGDGAYAEFDEVTGDLVLYTSNGIEITNRIVLETEVLESLILLLHRNGLIPRD